MSTAIVGSLGQVAQRDKLSIAETFLSADWIVLVDVSGSMATTDSRGNRQRYEVACEELARLQRTLPGKLAVIAFSDRIEFCPSGVPLFLSGGTDLASALQFVKPADGTVGFIVVSDGEPNDPDKALRIAASFTSHIDCIHIGPESDVFGGAAFLQRLAKSSGGKYAEAAKAAELAETMQAMMLGAGK